MLSSNYCEYRIEVYVPMYIAYPSKPLTPEQQKKFLVVNSADVNTDKPIDFALIAKRLESTLAHMYLPCTIKSAFSHCDRQPEFRSAYYLVKLHLPYEYLSKNPYLIKMHSAISFEDILEIKLVTTNPKRDSDLCNQAENHNLDLQTRIKPHEAIEKIKSLLNNKTFWVHHAPNVNLLFSRINNPVHKGIKALRNAVNQHVDLPFDLLRSLANDYCPDHDGLITRTNLVLQPTDALTADFFRAVCHADSIYDLVKWIETNQSLIDSESRVLRPSI